MGFFKNTDIVNNLTETTEFELEGNDIEDVFSQVSGIKKHTSEPTSTLNNQNNNLEQEGFEVESTQETLNTPQMQNSTSHETQASNDISSQPVAEESVPTAPVEESTVPEETSGSTEKVSPQIFSKPTGDTFILPEGVDIDGTIHLSKPITIENLI